MKVIGVIHKISEVVEAIQVSTVWRMSELFMNFLETSGIELPHFEEVHLSAT